MRVPTTTATGPVVSARASCIRGLKTRPRSHRSWTRCRGLVTFIYGRNLNTPDLIVAGGATYRITEDHLGSPRLIINTATGALAEQLNYNTFGVVTTDTNPGFQPFGYTGGLYDQDTRLVLLGARDYDPTTGRFTTKDPSGFDGGDTNLYTYVNNDPVNSIDPTGLGLLDVASWVNDHLNPMKPVVDLYRQEINAYENGCSYWDSVRYGLKGTAEAVKQVVIIAVADGAGRLIAAAARRLVGPAVDAAAGALSRARLVLTDDTGSLNPGARIGRGARNSDDQDALLKLAKRASKRPGGISQDDASALNDWADEYGIKNHIPMTHPGNGYWDQILHIKIANIHIQVTP